MTAYIDGDGCPVVDLAIKILTRHNIKCVIICDTSHSIERQGAETVVVSKGADSVDFAIVNRLMPQDIVITQDYGLAAISLAKRAIPINQNGLVYSDKNIDSLLQARFIAKKVRNSGGRIKGPPKRNKLQDQSFEKNLEALLNSTKESCQ